jgi:beta-phosphoglucomutase-like phosphatase (HAD superfamily)
MPTKTEKSRPKEAFEEPAAPTPMFGVLFQLEDVAVDGRKAAFEVLKGLLQDHKIVFTTSLFSRYCLHATPQHYLLDLLEVLGGRKTSAEKFVDEAGKRIAAQLSSAGVKMNAGLEKVLQEARERNMLAAAVTALPEATAQAIMAETGLEKAGVRLFAYPEAEKAFPGATTWLKTVKALALKPHNCAVLAGSMAACKAALSADMRCAAIPDEFTGFQDYSGASLVLESLDELGARELLDALFPAPNRAAG